MAGSKSAHQPKQPFWSLLLSMISGLIVLILPGRTLADNNVIVRVTLADKAQSGVTVVLRPGFISAATSSDGSAVLTGALGTGSIRVSTTVRGALYSGGADRIRIVSGKTTTVTVRLNKAPVKSPGIGPIRVRGQSLLVNGTPFQIRGIGYEPYLIGTGPGWRPKDDVIYRRDFPVIIGMKANVIRTWGEVDQRLLNVADQNRLRLIAGYWVNYEDDLTDQMKRASIIARFRAYVARCKSSPAILMWSVGNEQNYRNGKGSKAAAWYSLVNELAWAAYDEEGRAYHPVTSPNGEMENIGDSVASDQALSYLDVWGANIYRGSSFGDLFTDYARRSKKPFWVSEYGNDAYDHRRDGENQGLQSRVAAGLWKEINAAKPVCSGATIMAYCDQWWKHGNDWSKQTPGGFKQGGDLDGTADEAYWGLFAVEKDPRGGVDKLRPREVVGTLRKLWSVTK